MVEDFKRDGLWVRSFRLNKVKTNTLSGSVWNGINNRIGKNTYKDVRNDFENFQVFVEWHREQAGYGRGWQLDKDLLDPFKRVYSPDTCVLLPKEINSAISYKRSNGNYLSGASPNGRGFRSVLCHGEYRHLGQFDTKEQAHLKYKECKEAEIVALANKWKEELPDKTYQALLNFRIV